MSVGRCEHDPANQLMQSHALGSRTLRAEWYRLTQSLIARRAALLVNQCMCRVRAGTRAPTATDLCEEMPAGVRASA